MQFFILEFYSIGSEVPSHPPEAAPKESSGQPCMPGAWNLRGLTWPGKNSPQSISQDLK